MTLAPSVTAEPDETEDIRIFAAPPSTGLGTFDLGSVPASVTPPRSWRKAAWFATASSGGVVVALLFAGSALVAKPAPDQTNGGWVPGLGGGLPTAGDEQVSGSPGHTAVDVSSPTPVKATDSPSPDSRPARPAEEVHAPAPTGGPQAGPAHPGEAVPATTTPKPVKPPSVPAPYDADSFRFTWPAGDPAVFAQDSQKFLDTVTENPQAAYAMTTGELEHEGTGGLERKYAGIAFFEVKHIQVHQYDGETLCTVRTVYKDGRQVTEQHVLTFDDGKIDSAS